MTRPHGRRNSRQSTNSITAAQIFTSPADPPKKDKRPTTVGQGHQGMLRCPECGTLQTSFKASRNLFDKETMEVMGIFPGDLLIRRHTPEGKAFRSRRGDVRCKGSEMPVR